MAHEFCRVLLATVRDDARRACVIVPKCITALRQTKDQWFLEMCGREGVTVEGDCAYEARANFIADLIDQAEAKRQRERDKQALAR